jgi:hypothetical protein
MQADDPLESVSGTNGVTGAADAVLVLNRDAKGTTLYGRGRAIEEIETAMRFDGGGGRSLVTRTKSENPMNGARSSRH